MSFDSSKTAWISRGLEQLVASAATLGKPPSYDIVIIGSGYGGAIAADTFAGRTHNGSSISVCVLERGNEYLPGAFPAGFRELPTHVRMDNNKEGLFDIRGGGDVNTVVANGLGGGSLINAGVMEVPRDEIFNTGWPTELTADVLDPFYDEAKDLLGARDNGTDNTIELLPAGEIPQKYKSIKALADPATFRPAAITVAMKDTESSGKVKLNKCKRCGDCATGCNFGAKISLDVNLLVRARRKGAEIYTGATVLDFERDEVNDLWVVNVVYTNAKLRARHGGRIQIHASKLILASGALGSTEILMRSRVHSLAFSGRLGERCSTNGDMLVTDYYTDDDVLTVADEAVAPSARNLGPTITGVVDLRKSNGVLIEEMSVPAGLRRVFGEIFASVNALHMLDVKDGSKHQEGHPAEDIYEIGPRHIDRSALYAVMGDDGADGAIDLFRDGETVTANELTENDDGVGRIVWKQIKDNPLFDTQVTAVAALAQGTGGRILPNPAWKLLPANMEWLLNGQRGPLTTVHPLGGCVMGDDIADGVVDHMGRVFDAASTVGGVHDGLVVLDGSIVPTAIGTNPALTIAAVSLRATDLLATEWDFQPAAPSAAVAVDRPEFRNTDTAFDPPPTRVEIIERLAGPVRFKDGNGDRKTRIVELTMRFDEHDVAALTQPHAHGGAATLQLNPANDEPPKTSRIRVYDEDEWRELNREFWAAYRMEQKLDGIAKFNAPLTGTLRVFTRGKSRPLVRILRAGWAYLFNRGWRDIYQAGGDGGPGPWSRFVSGNALASRAGEIRWLDYELTVGAPTKSEIALTGDKIRGRKRFTYVRRANPWRQLMDVILEDFPGLKKHEDARTLKLDPVHLTRIGVPLFQITRQPDGATALAELISFFGYFVRLLVGIHIWSFRQPDAETNHPPVNGFPSQPQDLPAPETVSIQLEPEVPHGEPDAAPVPGNVLLTRFPGTDPTKRPVLMIHGYSASGTTFAHHALKDGFAARLWKSGRDIWIVDMRTSAAYKDTAKRGWSFEQIARRDLPAALEYVYDKTGKTAIDVHAHCMGTVVFSMAALPAQAPGSTFDVFVDGSTRTIDPSNFPQWIHRVAFSQVGPLVVMSPANIFRGYAMRYFVQYVPDNYQFRPDAPTLADDLLDRILYTLPYPEEEFDKTNPIAPWARAEWTRTRHRMDALYGRDFNVNNMPDAVLDNVDDHFGPLSIRTVTQTIHFARYSIITNAEGKNDYVSRTNLEDRWPFPTLSVHGPANGLADIRTLDRMTTIMSDAGRDYWTNVLDEGTGHQDALVGTPRTTTFDRVLHFFDNPPVGIPAVPNDELVAYPPWIGPVVTDERLGGPPPDDPVTTLRIGTRPTHRQAECAVVLPVLIEDGRVKKLDGTDFQDTQADKDYIAEILVVRKSNMLTDEGWDAFPRPDFNFTNKVPPGYDGPILVLVVYNESGNLMTGRESSFLYVPDFSLDEPSLAFLNPLNWEPEPRGAPPGPLPPKFVRHIIDAVLDELLHQPGLLADVTQPVLLSAPLADTDTFTSADSETAGAVLDRLRDDAFDIFDGVVTHRAPDAPKGAPDPSGTVFSFVSCQYPNGFVDEPVAYAGYREMLDQISNGNGAAPRFSIYCGDQVYVDPTAGLFDPSGRDNRYEQPYQMWLRNRTVRNVLRLVPSFMLLDDHEITNDWEPIAPLPPDPAKDNAEARQRGVEAYLKFQRGMIKPLAGDGQWYDFKIEGVPFFMLDTRSKRDHRTAANVDSAKLIPDAAMTELKLFLGKGGPKFVVTPSMLLPRHRRADQWKHPASALHSDGWDGYRASFFAALAHIAENEIHNVVFLSGDEHHPALAKVEIEDLASTKVTRLHSLHTAGAFAPFPFANARPANFLENDTFQFTVGGKDYECRVEAHFPAASNGFTYLKLHQDGPGDWRLDYAFGSSAINELTGGAALTL